LDSQAGAMLVAESDFDRAILLPGCQRSVGHRNCSRYGAQACSSENHEKNSPQFSDKVGKLPKLADQSTLHVEPAVFGSYPAFDNLLKH
jgi:hypothetical protein